MSTLDLSGVKAVFFDLDDTLCAYWDAAKKGLRRAFEQHGPDGYTSEEMVHFWAQAFRDFAPSLKSTTWYDKYLVSGNPTRVEQMRRALIMANHPDLTLAQTLADCYAHERDKALELFEESNEVLAYFRAKFPLGCITNGPADVQRQELGTLGIEGMFKTILIEGEMGFGKPLPAVIERAEKEMGYKGPEILMIGNAYNQDIRPGILAGWRTVWVRRPSDVAPSATMPEHKPEDAPEPDARITNLRELMAWL